MLRNMRLEMVPGLVVGALLIGALVVNAGCAKKSPLETLIENRARYTAEMNGFFIDEVPDVPELVLDMDADADAEADPAAGSEPGAAGEEMIEAEPIEVRQRATLDILVRHDSFEKLPGVTLDITMVDAGRNEKARWLHWVDMSRVERANPTQYEYVIEDVDYVEGDGFNAEVRHPIPESERGDYKEFQDVGS